ncbi:MAG: methionyl-tRNA formyltransferase, partial [Candidatus Omnitrophota bacterium]
MNIIFLGSSKFAVPALSCIISSSHNVLCVVTQPDRLSGRGLILSSTEVKKTARANRLRIYQQEDINSNESVEFLSSLGADVFVVVAFGQILSKPVLEIPRIMPINLHASLLPKYRGAAPVRWAIINGESQSGLTIIKMVSKLDAGPIILQEKVYIEGSDDAIMLEEKLSRLGGDLTSRALDVIQEGKCNLIAQNDKDATLAKKLKKDDGLICWDKPSRDICNLIRGCAG